MEIGATATQIAASLVLGMVLGAVVLAVAYAYWKAKTEREASETTWLEEE